MIKFIKKIFRYCPYCNKWFTKGLKRRRQSTAYVDEESNYITCCKMCFDDIELYWKERWEEYWSGRL